MKAKLSQIAPHKRMWKFEDGNNELMLGEIFLGSYSAVFGNAQQVSGGVAFRSVYASLVDSHRGAR